MDKKIIASELLKIAKNIDAGFFIPTDGETKKQEEAMRKLEREGFRFVNWIQAGVDENGQQVWEDYEKHGCAVMKKSKSGRHDYREVEPDGSVN